MNDRCRGTLIGLAVGDALGAAVEFRSPGSFTIVTGYRDGGPHGLDAGEWTDDADTTGAICGQLAGAYWGESGISGSLRSGLARIDMLEKAMAGLLTKQDSP